MSSGFSAVGGNTAMILMLFSALGGYTLVSYLLLKYPCFYVRPKHKIQCKHISHRGGAGENLENTVTAYKHALRQGSEMLEIDCHLSGDGQVVVCHDNVLERTTGAEGTVQEHDYVDLPSMSERLPLQFDQRHEVGGCEDDRRMPLLEEVFRQFPGVPFNIDIKVDNDDLIHKVADLVEKYRREDLTVWGNIRDSVAQKLYARNPSVPLLASAKSSLRILALFYCGLLPFFPLKESFFEPPMPGVLLKLELFHHNSMFRKGIIKLLDRLVMNRLLFEHLDKRGIQTYIWVLNHEEDYERAMRYGVNGIMTDFPSKLATFLEQRGGWVRGTHAAEF